MVDLKKEIEIAFLAGMVAAHRRLGIPLPSDDDLRTLMLMQSMIQMGTISKESCADG